MARSLLTSIGFVILFVVGVWFVGELLGYEIGLIGTLVASVALTLVANLVLMGVNRART